MWYRQNGQHLHHIADQETLNSEIIFVFIKAIPGTHLEHKGDVCATPQRNFSIRAVCSARKAGR